jgi:hypothetical protein
LKEAPPLIGQKLFASPIGPGGIPIDAYSPAKAEDFYYFESPDVPATVTVRRHLDAYERILIEAERRFATTSQSGGGGIQ